MSSVLVFLKKIPNAQAYKTLFGSAKERFIFNHLSVQYDPGNP